MSKKVKMMSVAVVSSIALLAGCGNNNAPVNQSVTAPQVTADSTVNVTEEPTMNIEAELTVGQDMANLLGSTNWQGTRVYDAEGNDLTSENANFIGLAKYDAELGKYEFFDASTGETRGDQGSFFITNDGAKRVLISETMKYQAVVDMTELTEDVFTYKRLGKDKAGADVEVFVEHIPYEKNDLQFTEQSVTLDTTTGTIDQSKDGDIILGEKLWNGTKVLDQDGNDLTEYNANFISLAKFDNDTNKYEFFNIETGESRGDYGYFDVINSKVRAHVSIGENKYGAALELTELNGDRFTYKRMGKNAEGEDVIIFVEHEPYQGDYKPEFSF